MTLAQDYREELKSLLPYWKKGNTKDRLLFYHNSKDDIVVIKFIGKHTKQTVWAVPVGDQYCLQDCGEVCGWINQQPIHLQDHLNLRLAYHTDTLAIERVFNLLCRVVNKPLHIKELIVFADDVGSIKDMLEDE